MFELFRKLYEKISELYEKISEAQVELYKKFDRHCEKVLGLWSEMFPSPHYDCFYIREMLTELFVFIIFIELVVEFFVICRVIESDEEATKRKNKEERERKKKKNNKKDKKL